MKNKFFFLIFLIIFNPSILMADEFLFDVSNIEIKDEGNIINAKNGKLISNQMNLEILANNYTYIKDEDFLKSIDGEAFLKNENIKIKFLFLEIKNKNLIRASGDIKITDSKNSLEIESETIVLDRTKNILKASGDIKITDSKNSLEIESETIVLDRTKNILKASGDIKITDSKNSLEIESETIVLDRTKNYISSNTKSTLHDKNKNSFVTKKFEYDYNKKKIKIFETIITDFDKNNFEIEYANVDIKSNNLKGKNIIINLNNKNLESDSEPRLTGENIFYSENITRVSNGMFTTCKRTGTCPPWKLTANEITHNKDKKSINYKDVWLNIYDVPVVYFPKFFHPDPTVKRQSGFLMPTFKSSPNKNTFFSIPYFKVLSENKDFTLSPRLYAKDQLLIQSEYRELNKNSNILSDFSFLTEKKRTEGHLFFNIDKNLDLKNFSNSKINLIIEQVSNDTYLKANKLNSPIIKDFDVLKNSVELNMYSEDTSIDTNFIIYEKLNKQSSDKYEFIFPRVEISKLLENKTALDGNFKFESDNFIHNYNTNIYERINTNNLIFNSDPKITKNGFSNNFEFIIKNSNTNSQKSVINKEGGDHYLSGLFQLNSNYPLIKKTEKYDYFFKPKISLKLNPGHTKDLSKNEYKIDVNNIFDLDRISSNETLEGGISLTYGSDYILTKKNSSNEFISFKFANNLRLKKNDDLEKNNQLGSKTSNFFTEIKFSPLSFLTAKYNLSTLNNLSDINYQNLITEIKFDKFSNTFDYLRQDGDKNSYFLNKTTYNLNNSNQISFSSREDLKSDLTEYYNLVYQYKNDCLAASIEYQKDYYNDRDIKPTESIFFKLTIIPFGSTSTPNLKQ